MILAEQLSPFAVAVVVAVFIGLAIAALFFFRGYKYVARRALERKFSNLSIHAAPQPGDVIITFHTYYGFIAWFTQTTHHVALPPQDARVLLGRLLRFNLTWGLFTWGAFFVPILSAINYLQQRRSIARQEMAAKRNETA